MSRVMLLAADRPLPLCDRQTERTKTVTVEGEAITVAFPAGFRVAEHGYYRAAVAELGWPMKPFVYELELEAHADDLADLKRYLAQHLASGETAELWNLWVGADDLGRPTAYRGTLAEFDMETLKQFLEPAHRDGGIGQCRMTVVR